MKTIFIGGENDGARMEVSELMRIVRLPVVPNNLSLDTFQSGQFELKTESYRREEIRTENGNSFAFYVIQGIGIDEALEMLLNGYLTPTAIPSLPPSPEV